jgi:hypothetical protein
MECQIQKASTLKSMRSEAVALMRMEAILISDAERATGQVSEQ